MKEKLFNRRTLIIFLIILTIVLGIIVYFLIVRYNNNIKYEENFNYGDSLLSMQKSIDNDIKNYIDDKSYTFDKPLILENPYQFSPLTALIIFQTNSDVSYDIYVNDNRLTTIEKSKKHSIPIYGLVSGKTNKVRLVGSDNTSKEYEIKTPDYSSVIKIDKKPTFTDNHYYFLTSTNGYSHFAINTNGEIVWYLSLENSQDIEFLSNGHILVCSGGSSVAESFTGFYEIDFLGKVYKSYSLKNNYHHEVNELSNGNLLVAGERNDAKVSSSYIYIIDRETGEEIKSLDLYELFNNIDSNYASSLIGKDLINNSLDYNEQTNELIISLRGLNSVMSINFETKEINWILGDIKDWSNNFSKYILKSSDNSRLPKGQHTAFIAKNGNLGLLNNDYDVNNSNHFLINYKNNYSSATYYEINKISKTYKTTWEYIDDDRVFNYALSSFNISDDNHKIINFGWSFLPSSYLDSNISIYDDYGQAYSRLVDLDENNNIVFRAALNEKIYRMFKNKFYNDKTSNYGIEDAKFINTYPNTILEEKRTSSLKNDIDNANEAIFDVNFEGDSIGINAGFDILEDVKIAFVNDSISYIYNYKPANQGINNRINLSIKGKYKVYIIIDGKYYKTNTEINTGDTPINTNHKYIDPMGEDDDEEIEEVNE